VVRSLLFPIFRNLLLSPMVKIIGILLAVVKSLYEAHLSLRDHSELCFG